MKETHDCGKSDFRIFYCLFSIFDTFKINSNGRNDFWSSLLV